MAQRIPGAGYVEVDGDFHGSWRAEDNRKRFEPIVDFLAAGGAPARPTTRALATMLFTDIVASTELAGRLGDSAWHVVLDQHDRILGEQVQRFGGRLVKSTGDGALASFDGPSRAISCARALVDCLHPLELRIRAGLHTGEVELRGDDVTGIGVVIARRICDLADGDEVSVTRTVKDLVVGSGIELAERGDHRLKGVTDRWQLFAAA
jgi:class 3 adenylate cyclase